MTTSRAFNIIAAAVEPDFGKAHALEPTVEECKRAARVLAETGLAYTAPGRIGLAVEHFLTLEELGVE